jgi:HEAT repeat protein
MSSAVRHSESNDGPNTSRDPALTREVSGWVTLMLRSIKTCRLYDAANPNVSRFREELADATSRLLDRCGTLRLDVRPAALEWEGQPVFQSQTRDDNLAGVFHRDGVRALTLMPGMAHEEVQGLLDGILRVTGPTPVDDDLVTLLWEANLPHVQIAAVPLEGDVDEGGEEEGSEQGPRMPWPGEVRVAPVPARASSQEIELATRSDDWDSMDGGADPEIVFAELDQHAAEHLERVRQERGDPPGGTLLGEAAALLEDAWEAGATAEDRGELAAFVPRVLREAIAQGEWRVASVALGLWRSGAPADPAPALLDGLRDTGAAVTAHAVASLDRKGDAELEAFLEFASSLGAAAAPWLMGVLADSQRRRVRQPLARVLAELVRETPDVLLPWLSDERWYVVRNVVHIYSQVGGRSAARLVKAVLEHPEARVRREAVEVLAHAEPAEARPLLLGMLAGSEPRLVVAILRCLAADAHADVTGHLLAMFEDPGFENRSDEERRAVLSVLATRGDAVLPTLERALQRGGLFSKGDDARRQAIAFCLARIGTAAAREALDRGAHSVKAGVRKACTLALNAKGATNA